MQTDWRFFMILACYSQFGVGCQAQNSPLQVKRPVMGWVFKQIKLYVTKIIVYFWVKQKTMKIYLYHTSGFFSSLFSQNHVHSIFQWYALQMTANETVWYFIFSRTQLFTLCLILNPLLLIIAALTALLRTQQQRFLHHFILTVWKLCLYIRLWALTKQTKKRTNQYPDGNSMVRWPEEV